MFQHFGAARWRTLSAVQVPHHGFRHSWELGNAARISPDYFVQCVPDWSDHHPHPEVTRDLAGFTAAIADYRCGVSIDYHLV
jgi:beta-lactamase superfamily II metal-dependent hydrolase